MDLEMMEIMGSDRVMIGWIRWQGEVGGEEDGSVRVKIVVGWRIKTGMEWSSKSSASVWLRVVGCSITTM